MANCCQMFSAPFGAKGKGLFSKHPSFLHETVRGTLVCITATSIKWSKLLFLQQGLYVRRALCLTSKFGWQFTDEIHNIWVALIFWYICRVLGHILEGHHNFWILHGCKDLLNTKNFIEPRLSWHSRHAPSHSRHFSRKITRHSPRKATWKTAMLRTWLSSGFFLSLGSLMFLPSLLNPSYSFFDLGLFTFSLILSPRFSNFLGPGLNFFQHCTSIFIIIQLTGKGKSMSSFFPMAQKSVCFPLPLVWLSWIRIYFNSFVSLGWQHLTSVTWWRRWLSWHTELPNEDLAWWHLWSSQWLSGVHHHLGHQWQPLFLSSAWSIISSVTSTFSSPISWGASASGSITFIVNF